MRRKRRIPPSPLPQRDGIDAFRVMLPLDGAWSTVRDHLVERLAAGPGVIDAMLRDGRIVG
ncbi:pseudouridylate synthase, partial [Streptomyces sp. NPDC000188]